MRKIVVFNNVTLDGYYAGFDGDMSWAHKFDPEWQQFTNENAKGGAVRHDGRLLADADGDEEYADGGRSHEQAAETGLLAHDE